MPFLSPTSTLLISTSFTTAYLGSIYLVPSARVHLSPSSAAPPPASPSPPDADLASAVPAPGQPPRDRNHPTVIKARLAAVSLASSASLAFVPFLLSTPQLLNVPHAYPTYAAAVPTSLKLLGLALPRSWKDAATLALVPLGLTASLFAGSFYVQTLAGELPFQQGWKRGYKSWWGALKAKFDGWRGVRNYGLAPLTEEITFRSCIIAISFLGGIDKSKLVFLSPLWFGLAHVHHAWDTYRTGGRTKAALQQGIFQSAFQFVYTTVFGWYAAFLFLRTGSLLPPFLAHALCNALGLPPVGWALQVYPEKKLSILASYAAGIAAFSYGLWRWTEPALYGGSMYWRV
ncbi:hypothetical protein JCM10207_008973 [Rhodosporidiobolus poonsookiae]